MGNCIDTKSAAPTGAAWVLTRVRTLLRWLAKSALACAGSAPAAPPKRSATPAMLMLVRDIGPLVTRVNERLERCGERRRERRRLLTLDDRALRDIGVSRADAEREYRKPSWRD